MIFNSFNIQDGGKDDSVVLKYEPVQYSTLKNEPQVHFSTGSFFNVTPADGASHDDRRVGVVGSLSTEVLVR